MWKWLADNWMGLTALLLSFDAERRLYLSTDWGVDKTDGDGWILRNNGWLTERDIRVTPTGGAIVEYRGASKLKRQSPAPASSRWSRPRNRETSAYPREESCSGIPGSCPYRPRPDIHGLEPTETEIDVFLVADDESRVFDPAFAVIKHANRHRVAVQPSDTIHVDAENTNQRTGPLTFRATKPVGPNHHATASCCAPSTNWSLRKSPG